MLVNIIFHAPGVFQSFALLSHAPLHAFIIRSSKGTTCPTTAGANVTQVQGVINDIVGALTSVGAAVCALGIAVGGIMRATSFGNERRISDSNTAITCAVVGLVTVLLAQGLGGWIGGLVNC